MLGAGLIFLLFLISSAFVFLFFFNIIRKIFQVSREKKAAEHQNKIMLKIDRIINELEADFLQGLDEFVKDVRSKKLNYIRAVDYYLLHILSIADIKNRDRYVMISWRLDLTSDCIDQIKNRNTRISALGSRRAGLYNFRDAAGDMISALDTLSGENQFEILMGLARMGNADDMRKAFEKIKNNILVNERAVIQILSSFPGKDEKIKFFRDIIRGDSDYLKAIFLKALDREMAVKLKDDIIPAMRDENMEVRTAAVRGLANLGRDIPLENYLTALEDHEWEVRAVAAKALESIKIPEASLALFRALFDQHWWVRQNAASALVNHPGYETLFILAAESGDEYTKDSIIYALEKSENPVLLRSIKILAA